MVSILASAGINKELIAWLSLRNFYSANDSIINNRREGNIQYAVGNTDRDRHIVCGIQANLGVYIQVAYDLLSLHAHIENTLPCSIPENFSEL
jgi:hypothetical protein